VSHAAPSGAVLDRAKAQDGVAIAAQRGKGPIGRSERDCYGTGMNPLLLIIILLFLFGGGGFYYGGPAFGGGGIGLILLVCLIIYLMGGFRGTKS